MLGHLSIGVRDFDRAIAFYDAILEPVGFVGVWSNPDGVGYGPPGGGDKLALFPKDEASAPGAGFHLAFNAPDRAAVDAFHAAAIAKGGTDNGPPGLRLNYSPSYYAAFVIDPEGWKLEAVHQ